MHSYQKNDASLQFGAPMDKQFDNLLFCCREMLKLFKLLIIFCWI